MRVRSNIFGLDCAARLESLNPKAMNGQVTIPVLDLDRKQFKSRESALVEMKPIPILRTIHLAGARRGHAQLAERR